MAERRFRRLRRIVVDHSKQPPVEYRGVESVRLVFDELADRLRNREGA